MGGHGLIPPEAWDHKHPDHDWWVNGRSWCFDQQCPDHAYRQPGTPEPDEPLSDDPEEQP